MQTTKEVLIFVTHPKPIVDKLERLRVDRSCVLITAQIHLNRGNKMKDQNFTPAQEASIAMANDQFAPAQAQIRISADAVNEADMGPTIEIIDSLQRELHKFMTGNRTFDASDIKCLQEDYKEVGCCLDMLAKEISTREELQVEDQTEEYVYMFSIAFAGGERSSHILYGSVVLAVQALASTYDGVEIGKLSDKRFVNQGRAIERITQNGEYEFWAVSQNRSYFITREVVQK